MAEPKAITIQIDDAQLRRLEADLKPRQIKQALFQAVKRTAGKVVTLVRKAVADRTFIKKKYVDRAVKLDGPHGDMPVATIRVSRKPIPLIAFPHTRSRKGGVTVRVSKDLPPIKLAHAFIARVASPSQAEQGAGHEGVFLRSRRPTGKNKLTPRGFTGRLAIEEQFGKPVMAVVDMPAVMQKIELDTRAEMDKQIQGQLDRFLKRETNG